MESDRRLRQWEKASEWPLTAAALVFLVGYAWPILDPGIADTWRTVCVVASWSAWGLFVIDYAGRLTLAPHRLTFVRKNLLDLAVVVLPLLRPLRLLRLVTLLTVLNRRAGGSLRGRVAVYVAGAAGIVMLVASLAILDAERGRDDATITTFGQALWWAMTTVTTVGYGDTYPVTTQGRFVAVGLMLAGIALIGVITATFASWLIERVQEVEEAAQDVTKRDILALREEIVALRRSLESGRDVTARDAPRPAAESGD